MRRLFGPMGLLVVLLCSEAVSERALKKTALVLYGERSDLPVIRAIYFSVLCR
jgi:hypothetical protein